MAVSRVSLLLLVLGAVLCVSASHVKHARLEEVDASTDPVEYKYSIVVGGNTRTFYVYVPAVYNTSTEAYPLMVFWHGATDACQSSANFMISGFTAEQSARKFLLVTGCGINKVWQGPVDLPFAEAIMKTVTADFRVNTKRIYSSGFSNGAGLTEYLGCRMPNKFAGLAIAAGWVMGDSMQTNLSNAELLTQCDTLFAAAKPTSFQVLKLQGSVDPAVVPYGRTSVVSARDDFYGWALRMGCKGSPTTEVDGTVYKDEQFHDCPAAMTVRMSFLYGIPHQWVQSASFNYNKVILDYFKITAPTAAARKHHHKH